MTTVQQHASDGNLTIPLAAIKFIRLSLDNYNAEVQVSEDGDWIRVNCLFTKLKDLV